MAAPVLYIPTSSKVGCSQQHIAALSKEGVLDPSPRLLPHFQVVAETLCGPMEPSSNNTLGEIMHSSCDADGLGSVPWRQQLAQIKPVATFLSVCYPQMTA